MIPNDDRPGPPGGGEMFLCPVNGCPWRHARAKPGDVSPVWAHSMEASVLATMVAADQHDEAIVRAHLAEHSPEEFARTIVELRAELAAGWGPERCIHPCHKVASAKNSPDVRE